MTVKQARTLPEIAALPLKHGLSLVRLDDNPVRPASSTLLAVAAVLSARTGRRLSVELRALLPDAFYVAVPYVLQSRDGDFGGTDLRPLFREPGGASDYWSAMNAAILPLLYSQRPDLFRMPALRAPDAIDVGPRTFSSVEVATYAIEVFLERATLDADLLGDEHAFALALHALVRAQGSRLKALQLEPSLFRVSRSQSPPHARALFFHPPGIGPVALPWRPALARIARGIGAKAAPDPSHPADECLFASEEEPADA